FKKWRGWSLDHWSYRFLSVALTFLVVLLAWVFFRAPNLPAAGRVLASMSGAHGLTMSDRVTNPARIPGRWWAAAAIRFVPKSFEVEHYTKVIQLIVMTLIIALFLPN